MATVSMNDDETEKLKELLTNICKNLDEKEN
jgi:hypothetical protein